MAEGVFSEVGDALRALLDLVDHGDIEEGQDDDWDEEEDEKRKFMDRIPLEISMIIVKDKIVKNDCHLWLDVLQTHYAEG